ncbi:hypothetical protein O9G_002662 [Rozella allomycis CSF55]|uniref:Uncharacterized protein n=1 Tax=Rozella allomycis (strain CSF55) TaxID=988480 RepID=A0A075B0B4_ROZAC|nr:hypothetical protein O9G_002662 [Rozella allomycis CSF55]|eukprot:EPZ36019.1 hypothetical protein O9G_002662 [Rozella allomycis CSF55]
MIFKDLVAQVKQDCRNCDAQVAETLSLVYPHRCFNQEPDKLGELFSLALIYEKPKILKRLLPLMDITTHFKLINLAIRQTDVELLDLAVRALGVCFADTILLQIEGHKMAIEWALERGDLEYDFPLHALDLNVDLVLALKRSERGRYLLDLIDEQYDASQDEIEANLNPLV